jgi:hypothetical protein
MVKCEIIYERNTNFCPLIRDFLLVSPKLPIALIGIGLLEITNVMLVSFSRVFVTFFRKQ